MIGAKDKPDQDLRFDSKPADQVTTIQKWLFEV